MPKKTQKHKSKQFNYNNKGKPKVEIVINTQVGTEKLNFHFYLSEEDKEWLIQKINDNVDNKENTLGTTQSFQMDSWSLVKLLIAKEKENKQITYVIRDKDEKKGLNIDLKTLIEKAAKQKGYIPVDVVAKNKDKFRFYFSPSSNEQADKLKEKIKEASSGGYVAFDDFICILNNFELYSDKHFEVFDSYLEKQCLLELFEECVEIIEKTKHKKTAPQIESTPIEKHCEAECHIELYNGNVLVFNFQYDDSNIDKLEDFVRHIKDNHQNEKINISTESGTKRRILTTNLKNFSTIIYLFERQKVKFNCIKTNNQKQYNYNKIAALKSLEDKLKSKGTGLFANLKNYFNNLNRHEESDEEESYKKESDKKEEIKVQDIVEEADIVQNEQNTAKPWYHCLLPWNWFSGCCHCETIEDHNNGRPNIGTNEANNIAILYNRGGNS